MNVLLRNWFSLNKRDLPWREDRDPYKIWISEVMLQQTQVKTVIPYFYRWIERFPNVAMLASAPLEEVLKLWEGLGYYSRAKNLHQGAIYICENFGKKLPESTDDLKRIPGLGPYTIAAIQAFAFKKRVIALDSNVIRVLSRFFLVTGFIEKNETKQKLIQLGSSILPQKNPWEITEALIELGALICKKKPLCLSCPLQKKCLAFSKNMTATLPKKALKAKSIPLFRNVSILFYQGEVLVRKVPENEIMGGLYEFPYFEKGEDLTFQMKTSLVQKLSTVNHSFTKYKATLYPHVFHVDEKKDIPEYHWVEKDAFFKLPFSSGHRKIIQLLMF